jgi:hypothetical protein
LVQAICIIGGYLKRRKSLRRDLNQNSLTTELDTEGRSLCPQFLYIFIEIFG